MTENFHIKSLALAHRFLSLCGSWAKAENGNMLKTPKPLLSLQMPKSRDVSYRNVVTAPPRPSIISGDSMVRRGGTEKDRQSTLPYGVMDSGSFLGSAM